MIIVYNDMLGDKQNILKLIYEPVFLSNPQNKRSECQLEWEQLNDHVFIRRPNVYFFTDLNEIHFVIFRHLKYSDYKYKLIINISDNKQTNVEHSLDKLKISNMGEHDTFKLEKVVTSFFQLNKLNNSKDFKLTMILCFDDMLICTKYPIDVVIRPYIPNKPGNKHSIICTEAYYFKKDMIQAFEWWIKLNRLHGYDKMVMYNHSLGNNDEFNQLFLKYDKFVQLNQLQCYPNLYGNSTQVKEQPFITLNEIKNVYKIPIWPGLHTLLEEYVLNECFTENRPKYKYITITDQDESIAPRGLLQNTIDLFKSDQDYKKLLSNYECYKGNLNNDKQETKLESYLSSVIKNLKKSEIVSFHFKMSIHLKNITANLIFKELGIFLNGLDETKPINYSVLIDDPNEISEYGAKLKFYLSISNKDELDYAKRIYKFHTDLIEPIFKKNKQMLDEVAAEIFNRVYILFGNKSTKFLFGKTVHNTMTTNDFTAHIGGHAIDVPIKYGHLSHFRQVYNLHWGSSSIYPITEFMFDFNYYNCYFKQIIKEFGFDFKEF